MSFDPVQLAMEVHADCFQRLKNAGRFDDARRIENVTIVITDEISHYGETRGQTILVRDGLRRRAFHLTIRHELAHVTGGYGHGRRWYNDCLFLGGNGYGNEIGAKVLNRQECP